jgi:hypothetical protein
VRNLSSFCQEAAARTEQRGLGASQPMVNPWRPVGNDPHRRWFSSEQAAALGVRDRSFEHEWRTETACVSSGGHRGWRGDGPSGQAGVSRLAMRRLRSYGQAPNRRALTVLTSIFPSAVVVVRVPSDVSPVNVVLLSIVRSPQTREYFTVLPWIS